MICSDVAELRGWKCVPGRWHGWLLPVGRAWGRFRVVCVLWLVVCAVAVGGCSGSPQRGGTGAEPQPAIQAAASASVSAAGIDATADAKDPTELSITELNEGPGVLELGVSKLLEEVGVLELLDSYVINVPPTAEFISRFELAKSQLASFYINEEGGAGSEIVGRFEAEVLYYGLSATSSVAQSGGSQVLHDAFFAVLEDCGRESAWPGVELFVMSDGRGYDVLPDIVEPTFGLSYFEYQQLKHECARLAATYPGLDEATRYELLGPQREHYRRVVVDGLAANPLVEVPARYRDEWDELVAEVW